MRKLEAYAEEYSERIAILMENGYLERVAQAFARKEVIDYAKKDGADIDELLKILT
jgi:hypothetical protein